MDKNSSVELDGTATSHGFAKVYIHTIVDDRVSDPALRVYLLLSWMSGRKKLCSPMQQYIAKSLNCSVNKVSRLIGELKKAGLIAVVHRGNALPNEYLIVGVDAVYGGVDNASEQNDIEPDCSLVTHDVVHVNAAEDAISKAKEKAKAARDKQARRTMSRDVARVTKKAVSVAKGIGSREIERQWKQSWRDAFPGTTVPKWNARDFTIVRELCENYGPDLTLKVALYVVENWDSLVSRFRLNGYPSIGFVNGFRYTIFPEIESGKIISGNVRSSETKGDQWDGTKSKTDSLGW